MTESMLPDNSLELDYELDLEFEEFEEFRMPQLSRGRYLHDFKVNKTAILDTAGGRCFLLDLDREEVPKPKSFLEIVRHLRRDGVYGMDVEEVRQDTRIVFPPLVNLSDYG